MAETLEEIANQIANRYGYTTGLYNDILTALRNERERCAKIADAHFESGAHTEHSDRCDKAIARTIREERMNSNANGQMGV